MLDLDVLQDVEKWASGWVEDLLWPLAMSVTAATYGLGTLAIVPVNVVGHLHYSGIRDS